MELVTAQARHRRRWASALGLAAALAVSTRLMGAPPVLTATEYEIKSAFLYNFAKFVEWPQSAFRTAEDPIILGLVGHDPFGHRIDEMLVGKSAQNRTMVVRRCADVAEAKNCHIVFISESEAAGLPSILKELEGAPVLTVSDMDRFVQQGGMIELKLEKSRVSFLVNKDAADKGKIVFSSQILKLARAIQSASGANP